MVTVGNGVTASVRAQIASLGANTLILVLNPSGRQAGSETPRPLINEDVDSIRQQIGARIISFPMSAMGRKRTFEKWALWSSNQAGGQPLRSDPIKLR
jgi:putative ABC transport system permease protein